MEPIFDKGYCNPQCAFLKTPITEDGSFDYTKQFKCTRYDVILDYYDWVLQHKKCSEEFGTEAF